MTPHGRVLQSQAGNLSSNEGKIVGKHLVVWILVKEPAVQPVTTLSLQKDLSELICSQCQAHIKDFVHHQSREM